MENLQAAIKDIFDYEILPPDTGGANIRAEYLHNNTRLDIAAAGSGFLQVLMLLAFLSAEKNATLLLDEPDAHLHILLQDRIFAMLKKFAKESISQLIMATHSERIINAVEPRHLCVLLDKPKIIADTNEKNALITALTAVDNTDIMLPITRRVFCMLKDARILSCCVNGASVKSSVAGVFRKTFLETDGARFTRRRYSI